MSLRDIFGFFIAHVMRVDMSVTLASVGPRAIRAGDSAPLSGNPPWTSVEASVR